MRFNAAAFDRHLNNIGQEVNWRRSYACACLNLESGQPNPKHKLCMGKGRLWDAPVKTVTGIAKQEVIAEWAQAGLWESGDMVLSIPQSSVLYDAGQFDRITMLNSRDVFSQPLRRGAPGERLLFTVDKLSRCFWLHPETQETIEAELPNIDDFGRPSWEPAQVQPPPDATYSLTGEKFTEYYLYMNFPSDRNMHSGMRLPKRVVARKWDLFGR